MARGLCARCKIKPIHVTPGGNKSGYCLDCLQEHNKILYMIKQDHPYDDTLAAQDGVCLICREPPGPEETFHYDHNHETGEFRGLLCHLCNLGIGYFRDRVDLLESAVVYLEDPKRIQHYMTGIILPKTYAIDKEWDYVDTVLKRKHRAQSDNAYKHRRNISS